MMDIWKIKLYGFFFLFFIGSQTGFTQKYYTRTGVTEFKASLDAFEPIEATNKITSVILNGKGEIAAQLFIGAFAFKIALMQEHFNENYMDADKFPKATFKGRIESFDIESLKKKFKLRGDLSIKGMTKEVSTEIEIQKVNQRTLLLKGEFMVSPNDFNIKIPRIVRNKIADKVKIILNYELSKKK